MDFLKSSTVDREISIDLIKNDPTVQPRFQQSEETIFRYALCLANGDIFPPIDVFEIGTEYLLADGGHRLEAYRLEGRDTVLARVHQGKRIEALIFASGCNENHGLLRNNKDKHRVVENVLKDPELGQWANNVIAKICMVSHPFVGKVREWLSCNGFKFDSVRVDANGRKMDTTNIGPKKPSAEPRVTANAPPPEIGQCNQLKLAAPKQHQPVVIEKPKYLRRQSAPKRSNRRLQAKRVGRHKLKKYR